MPVARHYQGKGLLKEVNATAGRDAVFNSLYYDFQQEVSMIPIKRGAEIDKMRRAGEIAAEILNRLADLAAPGISTGEIDRAAAALHEEAG